MEKHTCALQEYIAERIATLSQENTKKAQAIILLEGKGQEVSDLRIEYYKAEEVLGELITALQNVPCATS